MWNARLKASWGSLQYSTLGGAKADFSYKVGHEAECND
jgi:hypothetical protein